MTYTERTARLAGLFWLAFAVATGFSLAYVRNSLLVPGDSVASISNLSSSEGMYRVSIAAGLISQIFMFLLALTLFHMFRRASRLWSVVLLASGMVSVAVAVAVSMSSYAVLALSSDADHLAAFSEPQRAALAMTFLTLSSSAQGLLEIFWTPFFVAFGILVLRSKMLPAVLGGLLIAMGVGYFINVFTKLIVPDLVPELMTLLAVVPGALGTLATIAWLLAKGAREPEVAIA